MSGAPGRRAAVFSIHGRNARSRQGSIRINPQEPIRSVSLQAEYASALTCVHFAVSERMNRKNLRYISSCIAIYSCKEIMYYNEKDMGPAQRNGSVLCAGSRNDDTSTVLTGAADLPLWLLRREV